MTGGPHLIVAVPARDEVDRIGAALAAIEQAAKVLAARRPTASATVIVAADSCVDSTASVVRATGVHLVETTSGRVGAARAAAVERGVALRPDACWIACTDADSRVPRGWLVDHADAAAGAGDVLLGTVRPDPRELGRKQMLAWRSANPRLRDHRYVHGANLGVRLAAYRSVGGFLDVALHEDVLLVERLRAAGYCVTSDGRHPVVTSARTVGRVPGGFSGYLRSLG